MRLPHILSLLGILTLLSVVSTPVLAADRWCYTERPDAVFCDDFDRYCVDPPPEPERCDPQGVDIRNGWAMEDVWMPGPRCGWAPGVHDEYYSSYPYCAKIGCQDGGNHLGYGSTGLGDEIRTKYGASYGAMLATDLTPLTMEFTFTGRSVDKIERANVYVEVGHGRGGILQDGVDSLTNWVISDYCVPCGDDSGNTGYWPILCRQSPAPANCADVSTAPIIPAVAAGVMAFLDSNPCHCGEATYHFPTAQHLAFFNGRQWYTLRNGLFPDPGGAEPAPGDFRLLPDDAQHWVRLTIKSTAVLVEMRAGGVLSRCQVPLAYRGPFSSMVMGFQPPCQLAPGTWTCNGAIDCNGPCGAAQVCCLRGSAGGGTMAFDNVVLAGGQPYAEPGACCFPDTSCIEAFHGDCQMLGGEPAMPGSTCENTACCPPMPVDQDMDEDIDLQDFGWFQTCLSGTRTLPPTVQCHCADLDHDNDVDADDLGAFLGCMLGPEVPADPACIP